MLIWTMGDYGETLERQKSLQSVCESTPSLQIENRLGRYVRNDPGRADPALKQRAQLHNCSRFLPGLFLLLSALELFLSD